MVVVVACEDFFGCRVFVGYVEVCEVAEEDEWVFVVGEEA